MQYILGGALVALGIVLIGLSAHDKVDAAWKVVSA